MKKAMKPCIITLFLLGSFCGGICHGQSQAEILAFQALAQPKTPARASFAIAQNNNGDIQWLFSNLFLFYKYYISSQDGSHCLFTPSCSEYALIAIKKRGLPMGVIDFFDRFQRCNSLSPENYPVDKAAMLLYDPPF